MKDYMDWTAEDNGSIPKEGLYNPHRFSTDIDKDNYPYSYYYSYDHNIKDYSQPGVIINKGQSSVIVKDNKIFYSTNGIRTPTPEPIHKIIMMRYHLGSYN